MSADGFDPNSFERYRVYLGSHYVAEQTDAKAHPIMVIGKDRWSIGRFVAEVGVAHLRAARVITKIAELHEAKSLQHFYANSSPGSVAEVGFGVACLFTLFRTFESQGLNIDHWTKRQGGGWEEKATTFFTLKKHAAAAAVRDQPARRIERIVKEENQPLKKGRRR